MHVRKASFGYFYSYISGFCRFRPAPSRSVGRVRAIWHFFVRLVVVSLVFIDSLALALACQVSFLFVFIFRFISYSPSILLLTPGSSCVVGMSGFLFFLCDFILPSFLISSALRIVARFFPFCSGPLFIFLSLSLSFLDQQIPA